MLRRIIGILTVCTPLLTSGCESYFFLPGTGRSIVQGTSGSVFALAPFSEQLVQQRTFFNGKSVTTVTYRLNDPSRTPYGIDFNGDGKIDPVAGYALAPLPAAGVIQILLSQGDSGTAEFISLTLDGNNAWEGLLDVAVGDIDNDGALDIIGATAGGILYLRNPGPGRETVLREWGADTPELEYLSGSTDSMSRDELEGLVADLLPIGATIDMYQVTVEQGYTNVEVADLNRDAQNDVIGTQRLSIQMKPLVEGLPQITEVTGSLQIFVNPGNALDGAGWDLTLVGWHERIADLDRQGASYVVVHDMDGDGDLDLVTGAREDDNVQVAWFENPGAARIFDVEAWTQWRVGSVRDAVALDVADVTGDDRPDVLATGGLQMQLLLFEQPEEGPKRDYDWDTFPIVTFEGFEPRDLRIVDLDNDGTAEVVLGGTNGAVRYFEPPSNPRNTWTPVRVADFGSADIGYLGYGDLDGDGDYDLIVVADSTDDTGDRVSWIRNQLIP